MVCGLIPKWFRNSLIVIIICLIILTSLCSCDTRAGRYPFQIADNWKCSSPEFSLSYSTGADNQKQENEQLIWNGQTIDVDVMFGLGDYCVYPIDSVDYGDRLLTGTWKYRAGDLVLIIKEDFIFGNQYKELVFSPIS